jgi:hypothetical protein
VSIRQSPRIGDREAGVRQPIGIVPELHGVSSPVRTPLVSPLGPMVAGEPVNEAGKGFPLRGWGELGSK